MDKRWKARWITPGGLEREYRFQSLESRVIARIDLELQLLDLGYRIPDEVYLEEDHAPAENIRWDYPTIVGGQYGV